MAGAEGDAGGNAGSGGQTACIGEMSTTAARLRPVDVIWAIDSSVSNDAAVEQFNMAINDFAALLDDIDYQLVVLANRGTLDGEVCVPEPLAADDACSNGDRFFHSDVALASTQILEQILGTLGQTTGYQPGDLRGGEAWSAALRTDSAKHFVVVTHDNARLSADDFEHFPGGQNPFNSNTLPPGVLNASWMSSVGGFEGYRFHGIYGWGSLTDPDEACSFSGGEPSPNSGATYSTLVERTSGVRAQVCSISNWDPFLVALAESVLDTAELSCDVDLPSSAFEPASVNLWLGDGTSNELLPRVLDASDCGEHLAWYFDDNSSPNTITLCTEACREANLVVGIDKPGELEIELGCSSRVAD